MAYLNGERIAFSPKLTHIGDYNKGYSKGHDDGYQEGYDTGYWDGHAKGKDENVQLAYKQGEQDAALYAAEQAQGMGNKTTYNYWKHYQDITNLIIPYPMKPTSCDYMFTNATTDDGSTIDLSQYNIDFSKCTSFTYWVSGAPISKFGVLDTTSCSNINALLYNAKYLKTIEHLILKADGSQTNNESFGLNLYNLENINQITGQFGASFGFPNASKLTRTTLVGTESSGLDSQGQLIGGILKALKDYSAVTENGKPAERTLKLSANILSDVLQPYEILAATQKGWNLTDGVQNGITYKAYEYDPYAEE